MIFACCLKGFDDMKSDSTEIEKTLQALTDTPVRLRERFNSHGASIFSMRRELAMYTILSLDNVVCS